MGPDASNKFTTLRVRMFQGGPNRGPWVANPTRTTKPLSGDPICVTVT